jgi:hypothetical protein
MINSKLIKLVGNDIKKADEFISIFTKLVHSFLLDNYRKDEFINEYRKDYK